MHLGINGSRSVTVPSISIGSTSILHIYIGSFGKCVCKYIKNMDPMGYDDLTGGACLPVFPDRFELEVKIISE